MGISWYFIRHSSRDKMSVESTEEAIAGLSLDPNSNITSPSSTTAAISTDPSSNEETTNEVKEDEEVNQESDVEKAVRLYEDDRLLEAGRVLNSISDKSVLEKTHENISRKATLGEALIQDLKSADLDDGKHTTYNNDDDSSNGGWVIHGVSKGEFPTLTAHKLEKNGNSVELKARVETPIDNSMLSPFISVLNETELYETWLPSWTVPKFKVQRCQKLSQTGRCSQVLIVTFDLPWPIASREVVLLADAFDDIDAKGDIGIRLETLSTGDENGLVPPPDKSVVRIDVNGGFLIRKCPSNHPALLLDEDDEDNDEKKVVDEKNDTTDGDAAKDEKILITFAATMNPKLKLLPQSFLNFLVKVAFGIAWSILLKIARDVKNGKREDHQKAIQEKREVLYDWVELRLKALLSFNNEIQITGI